MTTPEDHLARVSRLSNAFELLFGAIRSSSYKGSHRRAWLSQSKGGTQRVSSALNDYDEAVHGESEKWFFTRMLQRCNTRRDSSDSKGVTRQLSFRMSLAMENPPYADEEKDSYVRMFRHIKHINADNKYAITKAQFKQFLQSVRLADEAGLDFACKAFQLMDLDGSGDIGECY
mmetsp:Transcript_15814/g.34232  ORF Transcript_15814/g.34232 Transcript_15814/m.34232 type:complete len:174 (-) Transcript_15814:536-1057(-)